MRPTTDETAFLLRSGARVPTVFGVVAVILISQAVPAAPESPASGPPPSAVQYLRRSDSRAPFSTAVRVGDVLYLSGQIGADADGRLAPTFADQARQVMANISATLQGAGSTLDDVFKCTVMLADMSHWDEFNKIYVTYFKPQRLPARSAFGANGLARGAMLELDCMAYSPAQPAAAR